MADVVITLNLATLRKYWLSLSAAGMGIWTSMNPAAQAQIIHYLSTAVHRHPSLTFWSGIAGLVIADLKQSPLAAPQPRSPVQEAPPYLSNKVPQ